MKSSLSVLPNHQAKAQSPIKHQMRTKKLPCCNALHENNKNYINHYQKSKRTALTIQLSFRKLACEIFKGSKLRSFPKV